MGVRQSLLALLLVVAAVAVVGHAAAVAGEEAAMVRAAAAGKVKAGTTLCCSNMTGFHECVEACFDYYPREQADKICDPGCQEAYQCRTVPGDECPSGDRSSDQLTDDSVVVGEVVHAETTLCCSKMTGFHECVEDCFAYFPREQADKICDPGCQEAYRCHIVSGDKCPSDKGNAAEKCMSGCKSSVCSKMVVTGVGSKRAAVKHALHRCNNACYKFCTDKVVRGGAASTA